MIFVHYVIAYPIFYVFITHDVYSIYMWYHDVLSRDVTDARNEHLWNDKVVDQTKALKIGVYRFVDESLIYKTYKKCYLYG